MKTFLLATAAAATLVAAPALAQTYYGPQNGLNRGDYGPSYEVGPGYEDPAVTGSLAPASEPHRTAYPFPGAGAGGYSFNPAADGNANQQDKPVKNYGQVSGGPAAAAGGW